MAGSQASGGAAADLDLARWFEQGLGFDLDEFQKAAMRVLAGGRSVLVAAPTGSGKTVVARFAIHLALSFGAKAVYTSPLKALSNEKFRELCEEHGDEAVGLLTGDVSIRPDSPILVMTTEVLRNVLYEGDAEIDRISHVVLDEIHYLQDPTRGSTWEEVILMLPPQIKLVCLSATISNTSEFVGWLRMVRGDVECVSQTERPVPLDVLYCYEDARSGLPRLRRLWAKGSKSKPNPALTKALSTQRYRRDRYALVPHRLDVLECLRDQNLMPCIYFIFSRAGCERAVSAVASSGLSFIGEHERREIEEFVLERVGGFSDAELAALNFDEFFDGLLRGVAPHHGGMLHPFKEIVERLFGRGLLKVAFATETLSLGIDMPARSVVLESFYKFDGVTHKLLTPIEFTQLSGRAGRRGKDDIGYAVILHSPWLPLEQVAATARSTRFRLASSFKPGYNMVANMIRKYPDEEAAFRLLRTSYAAYQSSPGGRRGGRRMPSAGDLLSEFNRYREVLRRLSYLRREWELSSKGETLSRVYSERDVGFVEWMQMRGDDLPEVPILAAVLSGFVADDRGAERTGPRSFRNRVLRAEAEIADEATRAVAAVEEGVFAEARTQPPDFSYALPVMRWARTKEPESLLSGSGDPGDVVRHVRRLIDLGRQAFEAGGGSAFAELVSEVDVGIVSSAVPGG